MMQTNSNHFRNRTRVLMSLALACGTGIGLVAPSMAHAQDRSQDRRNDRTQDNRNDRSQNGRDDRFPNGRDSQTQDRRTGAQEDRRRSRDESHVRFTRSAEERRFDNGVTLHRGVRTGDRRFDTYFPGHYVSYPHYAFSRDSGRSVMSPFSLYTGIFPPYIDRGAVVIATPRQIFIDAPIYLRGEYRPAYEGDVYDRNQSSDDSRWRDDRDLSNVVYDLEDTFRNEDIALLAPLTDPRTNIAIFARGRYQYSINANDYLDMTRDFLRSVRTTDFIANRVHRKTDGVYQVFTRHTYQDQDGQTRAVDQCFVVERRRGQWTITQIDSFPGRIPLR